MLPVLNPPLDEVTVWATWSLLVTVTFVPGATVMALGVKAKLEMVMASVLVAVAELGALVDWLEALPDDEHAVSVAAAATVTSAVATSRRARGDR